MLVLPVWNNIYVNFIYETQTQFFLSKWKPIHCSYSNIYLELTIGI